MRLCLKLLEFSFRTQIEDIIFLIVCGILAVATTLANVTVLIVLVTNKKLMNRQTVYRISLAMSDVLAGIIVFPSNIYSYCNSGTVSFNETYVNVIGFFTWLNIHVSIFSLIAAAIDRFQIVYQPLKYNAKATVTIARKICLGLWLISILLAITPTGIIYENFSFVLIADTIVLPIVLNDVTAFPIYVLTGIIIPITILWIFTILTFCVYKKHSKKRKKLSAANRQKRKSMKEIRFFFTLGIMVGVFTVCFLPGAILAMFTISTTKFNSLAFIFSAVMITSNSLWNFFIYSAREKEFRTTSKKLYKKLLFCFK